MSRNGRYRGEDSGVSPIVAAIMLIIATLFIGGMAFVAFRSQSASLSKNADIKIQSADLVTASGGSLFSVEVRNSGTVPLDEIEVYLPNLTESHSSNDFSGGTHENTVSGSLRLAENSYPALRVFDNPPSSGGGKTGTPISNVQELQDIQNNTDDNYYLAQDIDATVTENWDNGFDPIGTEENPYTGTFNGNGHAIENLHIGRGPSDYVGLFGYTSSATIENVGLRNENIYGGYETGGLVGVNDNGQVSNCYSTGEVSGGNAVGGLVGLNYNYGGRVSNCYSTGEVSGGDAVGGLVGYNYGGQVDNCYSTGGVDGTEYVGGLVGYNYGGQVDNSFWDVETSGQSSPGNGTGKTTEEMKIKSTFTDAGWDFEDVWRMGYAPSGRWTSSWMDLSYTVNYLSLETTTSIPGDAGANVRVRVSNDGSEVLSETDFAGLKDGFNEIGLESLPAARYVCVVYKLVKGSTPVVEDYRLNYVGPLSISLGSCKPRQTVSSSARLPRDAVSTGEKQLVVITGYVENKAVLKRTITVTAHG